MMSKMTCIIIDDEPLAREGLESFIKEIPFLELTGSFGRPGQALDKLKYAPVDLMFLDIQMPTMTGLELLQSLRDPPVTIISTAFSEYAVWGFELDVIDYLVKPVSFARFIKAVNKAHDYYILNRGCARPVPPPQTDFFFIKCDKCFEKVFYDELIFVQALQNYVVLQTEEKSLVSYLTIKSVEAYLPPAGFIRVNRSYIVSIRKIQHIRGNEVFVEGGHSFIIGRQHKEEVMKRVGLHSIKRS